MPQPISRRTLLKGTGAALALPWLEAMSRSSWGSETLSEPPKRVAFLFVPNGVRSDQWNPAKTEDGSFELTPMLEPLKGVKEEITVLENLWHKETVGRNGHWPKVPAWLSGGFVQRTSGRDINTGGVSVDQVLASKIGDRTPLPSLELGVDAAYTGVDNVGGGFTRIYGSHIAWRDPHTPVPKEIVPRLAFDRLFRTTSAGPVVSGFNPHQKAVADSLARDDASVLDLVLTDAKDLRRKVGEADQAKLDEYLESVRSVEKRIETALKPQKRWINEGRFDVPRPGPGIPESHEEHVRLMLDIMVLAFWTDTTRISTFMLGNAQTGRNFSFIDGVRGSFHGLSHHRNEENERRQYEKIVLWHMTQYAYLIDKMRGLDEGGRSLLDNSLVMYGSSIKDGNTHKEEDLPLLLAGKGGGSFKTNRRITAAKKTPLCNMYVSLLHHMGVEAESFGDSTGPLEGWS
ncbi:DUF1552 domain-containing protein [Blastopirellula sp. JC732]|uniref:DUF1552 domain-containing protein n=1 Tax=Blastopirellula sediminis TaxID=2894196 RepID=A0A9X1SG53_9BACT|nr:DUF1552 domain-containing protein [Blastopirellula sediminis]MCC9608651.1 DUF1552 domain-containing protein [Blastopirellula sediminis]MCC9628572.1 DUF1552 domain-containing protein [Blastopirellula sediminis]